MGGYGWRVFQTEVQSLWVSQSVVSVKSHIQTCCLKYSGHIEEVKKSFIAKTGIGAKGSHLQAETGTAEKDLNDFWNLNFLLWSLKIKLKENISLCDEFNLQVIEWNEVMWLHYGFLCTLTITDIHKFVNQCFSSDCKSWFYSQQPLTSHTVTLDGVTECLVVVKILTLFTLFLTLPHLTRLILFPLLLSLNRLALEFVP